MYLNKSYEIFPLIGVSMVKFGMLPAEVELAWGKPGRVSKNFSGDRTEIRDGCVITYDSKENNVAEIGFPSSYKKLTLGGVKIFQDSYQDTIVELHRLAKDRFEGDGFIVFPKLGISLSGFHGSDASLLTVTAFKAGWWDDELTDMAKMS
jgi:hypothetical protein